MLKQTIIRCHVLFFNVICIFNEYLSLLAVSVVAMVSANTTQYVVYL